MRYLSIRSVLAFLLMLTLVFPTVSTQAAKGVVEEGHVDLNHAALEVVVTHNSQPIVGALVRVEPFGLAGRTDKAGIVSFDKIAVQQSAPVNVHVAAAGFRDWTIEQPLLRAQDTLIIDAMISQATARDSAPEIVRMPTPRATGELPTPNTNPETNINTVNGVNAYSFPSTIKVQRVSLGRIDTVDFKYYVKHVLPHEWIPSWDSDSIKAGAVAAKEFAWYNTSIKRKYYWTTAYDVKDTTADQVYTPNVSYASTNAAVDATWSTIVLKNGAPFQTQFCAGASNASRTSGQCGELYGYNNFPAGYFMSQYGSQYLAKNLGYSWQSILTFYYTNSTLGTVDGSGGGSMPSWPVLRNGDNSTKVQAMQYLLRHRGYNITADGAFGPATESAVKSFQSSQGLVADGIVGQNTFTKLIVTVRQGNSGHAVSAIQVLLGIQNTAIFGATTDQIIRDFQRSYNLTVDGIVGAQSWQAAFGK